jgi:ABC-type transporter Mla subunit MlaD
MPQTAIPVLASFSGGSILTLVLPLGVLVAVVVWYVWLWRRGAGER